MPCLAMDVVVQLVAYRYRHCHMSEAVVRSSSCSWTVVIGILTVAVEKTAPGVLGSPPGASSLRNGLRGRRQPLLRDDRGQRLRDQFRDGAAVHGDRDGLA